MQGNCYPDSTYDEQRHVLDVVKIREKKQNIAEQNGDGDTPIRNICAWDEFIDLGAILLESIITGGKTQAKKQSERRRGGRPLSHCV
jgi:hypothetical protein